MFNFFDKITIFNILIFIDIFFMYLIYKMFMYQVKNKNFSIYHEILYIFIVTCIFALWIKQVTVLYETQTFIVLFTIILILIIIYFYKLNSKNKDE